MADKVTIAEMWGEWPIPQDYQDKMRAKGGTWYAYQCQTEGHDRFMDMAYLQCGPDCTFQNVPNRYPPQTPLKHEAPHYLLVGIVNLETMRVDPVPEDTDVAEAPWTPPKPIVEL